jgi:hypothetical protein
MSTRIKTEANKAHKISSVAFESMCVCGFRVHVFNQGKSKERVPENLKFFSTCTVTANMADIALKVFTSILISESQYANTLEPFLSWLSLASNIATNSPEAHLYCDSAPASSSSS